MLGLFEEKKDFKKISLCLPDCIPGRMKSNTSGCPYVDSLFVIG